MENKKIGLMSAENMGRATYRFVRQMMREPVIREKIERLAAQLDAEELKNEGNENRLNKKV